MSAMCVCPRGASIPTIPVSDCPETFGQIQKVAFQRLYTTTGVKNGFMSPAQDIKLKANWMLFMAATDDTKIAISPFIQAPTTEVGGPRTFGGGNETLSGIEEIIGRDPTQFTGVFRKMQQEIIKVMKALQCEELGVYLFDENGTIGALSDGAILANYYPIPIRSFFVGDKALGGYEAPDSNNVQWAFVPNWSDDLVPIIPTDFNPLSDLR